MLERKTVGLAPASRFGIIRALVCAAALASVFFEYLPSFSEVSTHWFSSVGALKLFPQNAWNAFLSSPSMLLSFQISLTLFLLLAMIGLFTNFTVAISAGLYFIYVGILRSYGTFFNQGFIVFYLLALMVFLPAGAGFSLDAKRKYFSKTGNMAPDAAMAWAVFLLRAVIAFSYWQAAWAKLDYAGIYWLEPENLKRILVQDNLALLYFNVGFVKQAMHLPNSVWSVLAGTILFLEFFFPLVLFRWELRRFYPILIAVMQIIMLFLCPALSLETAVSLVLLLTFYDWDRVLLRHKLPAQDRRI